MAPCAAAPHIPLVARKVVIVAVPAGTKIIPFDMTAHSVFRMSIASTRAFAKPSPFSRRDSLHVPLLLRHPHRRLFLHPLWLSWHLHRHLPLHLHWLPLHLLRHPHLLPRCLLRRDSRRRLPVSLFSPSRKHGKREDQKYRQR